MVTHQSTCGGFWGDFASIPEQMSSENIYICNSACQSCCDNQAANSWFLDMMLNSVDDVCACASQTSIKDFRSCVEDKIFDQLNRYLTDLIDGIRTQDETPPPTWYSGLLLAVGGSPGGSGIVDLTPDEIDELLEYPYNQNTGRGFARTWARRLVTGAGLAMAGHALANLCTAFIDNTNPEAYRTHCLNQCARVFHLPDDPDGEDPEEPEGPEEPERPKPPGEPAQLKCPGGGRPGSSCRRGNRIGVYDENCKCETVGPQLCVPPPGTPCANGGFINDDCLCESVTVTGGFPNLGGGHPFVCPACTPHQYY